MFGPIRGPWGDAEWTGWWGEDPPYHHPIFVLTHHVRPPLAMQGGTTFHFVDDRQPGATDQTANEVTLAPKRNGRWQLNGDLDAETATLIANELRRLANAYRDDEKLSLARRTALAFMEMARRSITLGQRGPGSRPELVIVASAGVRASELYDTSYEHGTPISRKVFENLSCDATARGLLMNGLSEALDLGRSQRLATAGQCRAAVIRDGGCVYPGCEQPPDSCDSTTSATTGPNTKARPTSRTSASFVGVTTRSPTASGSPSSVTRNGNLTIHDGTPLPWPGQQAA